MQLAPITPAPTEPVPTTAAPVPVPVPVDETPAPVETAVDTDTLPDTSAAPSPVKSDETPSTGADVDAFNKMYGAPSSAYTRSNGVMAVIGIGSALVWTLAGFM